MGKNVLLTGSAGFIGMHTALRLQKLGFEVLGIDNLNTYYSVELKLSRLKKQGINTDLIQYGRNLSGIDNLRFIQLDITNSTDIESLFERESFDYVVHLAAQAGVRYSIENPHAYVDSNVKGFMNILEACRNHKIKHLLYASSSSVYGLNEKVPFSETDQTDSQVSLYAATKKANEAMAHSFGCVHDLRSTGLRFFTVYGPYGRPDMAIFKFTDKILNDQPIDVYNHGALSRDFTYIDDIVQGIVKLVEKQPKEEKPSLIFNIGKGQPIKLMDFILSIEKSTGKKAALNMLGMQPGDVEKTWAETKALAAYIDYAPEMSIEEGVKQFVAWYKEYFQFSEPIK